MNKLLKDPKVFLIFTICLGLIISLVGYNMFNSNKKKVPVLKAKFNINQDDVVTTDKTYIDHVHVDDNYNDAVENLDPEQIAIGYIPAGTIIRKSMLKPKSQAGVIGILNKYPDRRAVALKADIDTTVGNTVTTGSLVQVSAIYDVKGSNGTGSSENLLDNIPVLKGATASGDAPGSQTQAIVLALTPGERDKLNDARAKDATIVVSLYGPRK